MIDRNEKGKEPQELNQEEIEKLIGSKRWQDQAYAFSMVLENDLWRDFKKNSGKGHSMPYASFSDFCLDQGVSAAKGYKRAELARNNRFNQVRNIDMSVVLFEALGMHKDNLFKTLILLKKLGVSEQNITQISHEQEPMKAALEEAKILKKDVEAALAELNQLLLLNKEEKGT